MSQPPKTQHKKSQKVTFKPWTCGTLQRDVPVGDESISCSTPSYGGYLQVAKTATCLKFCARLYVALGQAEVYLPCNGHSYINERIVQTNGFHFFLSQLPVVAAGVYSFSSSLASIASEKTLLSQLYAAPDSNLVGSGAPKC